ncbi:LLM class flavin-dependent oxidoreductase [Novosphingobium album (ex Hu et al. 2023)]|uniref:LLM class flavin-dependent oxidoreductase n=1 Tax=Novosphingobium album (ex Hu et al. 2023) TaxID=2930093 RepID=A0ABT0AW51_9SPHN|nr:LLM class flavin-dependent oxidoreductase [Novosphingobium album (ex Hu et al. 2023)]MCJ2176949.1 LLM class flavin-dependent oxidoreductase [Novosphingobium album (ex Hu et al. 2023)]
MFKTVISFDMRAPEFGAPSAELYKAALEMCAFADEIGIDAVVLPEHHCSEDGYNPVPSLMASAVAARTDRIAIMLGALVLPLHDPVELAETIAVTDIISGGRLYTTLVPGYVDAEFSMFGKSLKDRARLMDEGLDVIARALSGERFQYGEREVFVRPLPVNRPPRLLVGGGVPAAARRAAKHGFGFWVLQPSMMPESQRLIALYEEECAKNGHAPGPIMSTHPAVHVTHDPDAEWEKIGPHIVHMVKSYASWASDVDTTTSPFYGLDNVEAIRKAGIINVMTPAEAIAFASKTDISLTPLIAGLAPEIGWNMLRLFASEVLPHLKNT